MFFFRFVLLPFSFGPGRPNQDSETILERIPVTSAVGVVLFHQTTLKPQDFFFLSFCFEVLLSFTCIQAKTCVGPVAPSQEVQAGPKLCIPTLSNPQKCVQS